MKRFSKVSRSRWVALGGSMALAALLFALRLHGLPTALHPDSERQALLVAKARLAPYTPDSLASLRSQLARLEERRASPPPAVPVHWRAQALTNGPDGAARIRYTREGVIRWTELVDFIGRIEEVETIKSLDIRSGGTLSKREISSTEIIVRGVPGTTRRQSGATSPDAGGPASSRKVGRGPSLRLASSVAGGLRRPAPAYGPASALSRPDPPAKRPAPRSILPRLT